MYKKQAAQQQAQQQAQYEEVPQPAAEQPQQAADIGVPPLQLIRQQLIDPRTGLSLEAEEDPSADVEYIEIREEPEEHEPLAA